MLLLSFLAVLGESDDKEVAMDRCFEGGASVTYALSLESQVFVAVLDNGCMFDWSGPFSTIGDSSLEIELVGICSLLSPTSLWFEISLVESSSGTGGRVLFSPPN